MDFERSNTNPLLQIRPMSHNEHTGRRTKKAIPSAISVPSSSMDPSQVASPRISSAVFRAIYQTIIFPRAQIRLAVAAARTLGLVGLRPEVDALSLLARSQVPWAGLVDGQFLRDGSEELLYVLACLGGRLKEEEAGFAGVLLGVGGGDGALVGGFGHEIELVAGKGDDNVLVGLALEFLDPGFCLV